MDKFTDELEREIASLKRKNTIMHVALTEIFHASRDQGLSAMVNWMRGRAAAALAEVHHL